MIRFIATVAILCAAATAAQAQDIAVSLNGPQDPYVYDMHRYTITIDNLDNGQAKNVMAYVQLPETATSPTVHVMGSLGGLHRQCSVSGTIVTCNFGRIRGNRSKSRWFEIALPQSLTPLEFIVEARTSSNESSTANNALAHTQPLKFYDTPVNGPRVLVNRHCTGQGLTAFFECTLFPTSISSHQVTLEANGTITFSQAGYTGTWQQLTDDSIHMVYMANGQMVAAIRGSGVGQDCFEGLAVFPGSSYVAPYEMCLQ